MNAFFCVYVFWSVCVCICSQILGYTDVVPVAKLEADGKLDVDDPTADRKIELQDGLVFCDFKSVIFLSSF